MSLSIFATLSLLAAWSSPALADPREDRARSKAITFDENLVESLNKNPMDSLEHIARHDAVEEKPHLYEKKLAPEARSDASFDELLTEMGAAR
jgi:hypothetical protein